MCTYFMICWLEDVYIYIYMYIYKYIKSHVAILFAARDSRPTRRRKAKPGAQGAQLEWVYRQRKITQVDF